MNDNNTQSPNPVPTTSPAATAAASLPGVMDMFTAAWGLYRAHRKILVGIYVVPSILFGIGQIAMGHSVSLPLILIGLLFTIAGFILSIAMQPAALTAVHQLSTGPETRTTLTGYYEAGLRLFWPALLLSILQTFMAVGAALFLVVPAVIMVVYTCFYLFARVIDGRLGRASLVESYLLVRGRWLKVFGRLAFMGIITIAISIMISIIAAIIVAMLGLQSPEGVTELTLGADIIYILANLATISVVGPLMTTYAYRLYMSLKNTRMPVEASPDTGSTFRKWIVAFAVFGLLAAVAAVVIGFAVATTIRAEQARVAAPAASASSDAAASGTVQATTTAATLL